METFISVLGIIGIIAGLGMGIGCFTLFIILAKGFSK